ncbi:RidA family protein [Pinisolibacter aquiterrae]|uniref:RidA family protein n=1 Tax=Pinisolibacter aquiterrae TaxID=2815579 RepID=UPI001C3D52B1|nr:RidA family protein [Pinisolibacter aquiterrae]MBV5262686.1 RidA family protein [Pinisolibacter aquiterrae]MCC8236040.1 RidA family protein [Pinisolibacter aquiterrae]
MTIRRLELLKRTSMVSIHRDTVYVAGQCGSVGDDIRTQTRTALAKVERWLEAAGSDKSKLLQATIWLADMADFDAMNEVWEAWIDPANPPCRATGVVRPAVAGLDVEVIVVAAL